MSENPVLPVLDVRPAAERFRRPGLIVEVLDPATAPYVFVRRDDVVLHLSDLEAHPKNGNVCI